MPASKVVYEVEGPDENNNHLDLSDLYKKIGEVRKLLNSVSVTENKEGRKVSWRVVSLSHSSPVRMEFQPSLENKTYPPPVQRFKDCLHKVREDKTEDISNDFLEALEALTKPEPKKIRRAQIQTTGETTEDEYVCELNEELEEKLMRARSEEYVQIDTVDGKLEMINVHGKHTFRIYTWAPANAVIRCGFPPELTEQVKNALKKWVSVTGESHSRPNSVVPYRMDVHEIEVMPEPEELPSLRDLYGIAPNATGDKSPEEFVRKLRDEWGKSSK